MPEQSANPARRLTAAARPGLNRILWDMREPIAHLMPAGEYLMTLQVGDRKLTQKACILEPLVMVP